MCSIIALPQKSNTLNKPGYGAAFGVNEPLGKPVSIYVKQKMQLTYCCYWRLLIT